MTMTTTMQSEQITSSGRVPAAPTPLRILCVDDEPAIHTILAKLLGRAGHVCEMAANGQQALERVRANPAGFDLVLTDDQMPVMSGLNLVVALRGMRFAGRIAVHSSCLSTNNRAAYKALGVDVFVDKPTDSIELFRTITELGDSAPPKTS